MHSDAKNVKHITDADLESTNTPSYEQGKSNQNNNFQFLFQILTSLILLDSLLQEAWTIVAIYDENSRLLLIAGTMMTLRPRGGLLNSKKITGTQDYVPTCNKDTTGIIVMFLI